MAEIAKSGVPSISTRTPPPNAQLGNQGLAGEAIAAGDACYIKNDGTVWRASGAGPVTARVRGFAAAAASVGEAVTLVNNVNFRYGAALVPGTDYFLSGAVAGGIADAASANGTTPIAFAIDTTRIRVLALK